MAAPITSPASFAGAHILSIKQFTPDTLDFLCASADAMRTIVRARGGCDVLRHRVLANIFYEPSTRTSSSFAAAMQRLGGTVLQINEVRVQEGRRAREGRGTRSASHDETAARTGWASTHLRTQRARAAHATRTHARTRTHAPPTTPIYRARPPQPRGRP